MKIDRQLFETARETLQEVFDELEAAGGVEEYLLGASKFETSLVKTVIGLCEQIRENFCEIQD